MKTKFLTLNNLYEYFNQNENQNYVFSAKSDDDKIVVQVPGEAKFEQKEDPEGLFGVTLYACHDQDNLNKSYIDTNDLENAFDSFANKPILAYIHEVDGQYEFYTHNMHMEDDELIYDEVPVGIIPETNNIHYEHNDENDKNYVVVDGYLYEEYSKAPEIVRRDGGCFCSIELSISEMKFDGKTKLLHLTSFDVSGITLLGKTEDGDTVMPGMEQAHVEIKDFSKKENSMFSQEIVQKLDELKEKLDNLSNFGIDIKPKKKGGEKDLKKEFETEDATSTAEEATQATEEEAADATAGEETTDEPKAEETEQFEENDEESTEEGAEEGADDTSEEGEEESGEDAGAEAQFSKTFELSHNDVRVGLYALLAPFEEADNEWYDIVDVFDDYFVYQGWRDTSHLFKQSYTKNNDVIEFSGERIHLNAEYLTDNELAELNAIRSNYAEISEKLAKYEAEPQKVEKIQSEEYSMIRDTEEFKKIESDHFDLSVEQIAEELDKIVLSYAKAGKVNFAKNEEPKATVGRKVFGFGSTGKSKPYGGLIKTKE